jgi:hypothetical protein
MVEQCHADTGLKLSPDESIKTLPIGNLFPPSAINQQRVTGLPSVRWRASMPDCILAPHQGQRARHRTGCCITVSITAKTDLGDLR